jgi:hypothetical protein
LAAWQNIECFGPHPEHTGSLVWNIVFKHYTEIPEGYVVRMVGRLISQILVGPDKICRLLILRRPGPP